MSLLKTVVCSVYYVQLSASTFILFYHQKSLDQKMIEKSLIFFKSSSIPSYFVLVLLMVLHLQCSSVKGRLLSLSKPNPNDAAAYARWLVSQNSWGVLKYFTFFLTPSLLLDFFFEVMLYILG